MHVHSKECSKMSVQEKCSPCVIAILYLMIGVVHLLPNTEADTGIQTSTATIVEEIRPSDREIRNNTSEVKLVNSTEEQDFKITFEQRKKPLDFKGKTDPKYHKTFKYEDSKGGENTKATTSTSALPMKSLEDGLMETTKFTSPLPPHTGPMLPVTNVSTRNETFHTYMTDAYRGRALNISAPEPVNSLHFNITDLSDVSMDDDDKEVEGAEYVAPHNGTSMNVSSTLLPAVPLCIEGNRTYAIGEKIIRSCEEKCICGEGGEVTDCKPLCTSPYIRANKKIGDPLCQEKLATEEPCCAILICAADSAPESEETCLFKNKTIMRGQRVEEDCSSICICEAGGNLKCQPRCPPNDTISETKQHDRCVILTDPRDSCCTIMLCDVTLDDHEFRAENSSDLTVNLTDVKVLNSTAIKLKLFPKNSQDIIVEISENNHVWRQQKPDNDGILSNLEPAHSYYVRVTDGTRSGPAVQVFLPAEVIKSTISDKIATKNSCTHIGKTYKVGAEWYDECISFCTCIENGKTECLTIECPTDFGLDVLDPHCLDWETVPPNFAPKPPHCCPQEVRCRNNGSCNYKGKMYENWSELPLNVTGCEKRCYCEMGNVSCQAACPPVPALPPATLPCPSYQAALTHLPGDECCLEWSCNRSSDPSTGMHAMLALPGPLSTNMFNHETIDDSKRSNNKSDSAKSNQHLIAGTSFLGESGKNVYVHTDQTTTLDLLHYPMDPGHPTVPYNGPYNPDYKPTEPSIEDVFHLSPHTEKSPVSVKEKIIKSKTDAKKPVEPMAKPHKDDYFPGPLAPDKFMEKDDSMNSNQNHQFLPTFVKSNKMPLTHKVSLAAGQPHFVSLNSQQQMDGQSFPISSIDNYRQDAINGSPLNSAAVGPTYQGSTLNRPNKVDSNIIVSNNQKKKTFSTDMFEIEKGKLSNGLTGRPKQNQRNPEEEILPDQHYHLISLQHPGLMQLEHGPPEGHSGLYEIHQQITAQKPPTVNQLRPEYFATTSTTQKKTPKPQIYTQKDENGQTTYHIHTSDIPNSPQQIEQLLAHISQHDPNPGPFQHYPGQPAINHNLAGGPTNLPIHIDAHIPHSGLTHLNHPFAAPTRNQSGMDLNVPSSLPLPAALPGFPVASTSDEVTVQILEALNENTVRLVFTVPQVLVGLHGRVELRYTSDKTNFDVSTWKAQIFAPPNDLIATPQLEFELDDLKPATEYKVKITVKLNDLSNSPSSKIYSVKTMEKRNDVITLPPQIPIDAELRVTEKNSTWVVVMWRKFTDYELQFIDGVQLKYKERDSMVFSSTSLIHRAVTNYMLQHLTSATTYDIEISFAPFPGQLTELINEKVVQVTTAVEPDPYSFDVKVEIKTIKSTEVEITWNGVPEPENKYVNIYRAIYQSDSGKEDTSTFKIAKWDMQPKTVIGELKPGTRYRLWLEIYLTNGRIKKSNVQDFVTKPGVLLPATVSQQAGKLASLTVHDGDYYGPLIVVAIVASLAILSTLILLMILMKRRTSSKADISARKNTSAYNDNPSYKVELQQETMDL